MHQILRILLLRIWLHLADIFILQKTHCFHRNCHFNDGFQRKYLPSPPFCCENWLHFMSRAPIGRNINWVILFSFGQSVPLFDFTAFTFHCRNISKFVNYCYLLHKNLIITNDFNVISWMNILWKTVISDQKTVQISVVTYRFWWPQHEFVC